MTADAVGPGIHAWLYDSSGNDTETEVDAIGTSHLTDDQLLWLDLASTSRASIATIVSKLSVPQVTVDRLLMPDAPLRLDNYGEFFSLSVMAIVNEAKAAKPIQSTRVIFLVGNSWLVSIHDGPVQFITGFRAQDKGDTNIGQLSPALLLSALLDWHLSAFLEQVSHIESSADRLDESILKGIETRAFLGKLVKIRSRVSTLRRLLAEQRGAIYGLSRPDITLLTGERAKGQMEQIAARFDRAIDEVERSRDVIIGSFDLFTTLTAQTTNELVKVLTYVTVVIGLCGAVAGLMGMNFDLPLFKTGTTGFMSVVAGLAIMTGLTFGWAKWRNLF